MFAALRMLFVFLLFGVPAALAGIPWSVLRGNARAMYKWAMFTIRAGDRAGGIRVVVEGLENIPAQPGIIMSNHVSNLDPPVLLPSIPGVNSVVLKQSLMRIPLLGTAMRLGRFVPVSRGRSQEDARRSVQAAADALAHGMHILVFPEGTRSPDGQLLPFKKGAFFLAVETGAPIVPTVVTGTAKMMSRGSLKVKPGTATVRFLPAIHPADYESRDDVMAAVRAAMAAELAQRVTR